MSFFPSFSATILSCGWIIYLTYYNSRNIGLILTLIINRLYKDGYIHIGVFIRSAVTQLTQTAEYFIMSQVLSKIISTESELHNTVQPTAY